MSDVFVSDYNESVRAESCHFCPSEENLQTHHIVPQRKNGNDEKENLVIVCKTCHRKLESMYGKRIYEQLGLSDNKGADRTHFSCLRGDCNSAAVAKLKPPMAPEYDWYCEEHAIQMTKVKKTRYGSATRTDIQRVVGDMTKRELEDRGFSMFEKEVLDWGNSE